MGPNWEIRGDRKLGPNGFLGREGSGSQRPIWESLWHSLNHISPIVNCQQKSQIFAQKIIFPSLKLLHSHCFYESYMMWEYAAFAQTLKTRKFLLLLTTLTILTFFSYLRIFTLLSYFRQCKRGSTEASSHLEELVVEPPADLRLLHGLGLLHPGEGTLLERHVNHKTRRKGKKDQKDGWTKKCSYVRQF